jgi:hypothetical protein
MKIYLQIGIGIMFLTLSGCCNKLELMDSYSLSEFEKSLVPFTDCRDLVYYNEKGERIKASTQPRTINIQRWSPGPESCHYEEYEELNNFINFWDDGFSIQIDLSSANGYTSFGIKYVISGNIAATEILNIERAPFFERPLLENSKDTILNDFEFKKVFVFNNPDVNNRVKTILFSAEGNGVEFISFTDDAYLKLE